MKKLMKPRKSRKKERETWLDLGVEPPALLYHESKELFERLFAYCRQDVLAEEALSERLDDLSPSETTIFLMDQRINARGFQLDREAVDTALTLVAAESTILNRELATLTKGRVKKATQRAQMLSWFTKEGLDLPDTQGNTIDAYLHLDYAQYHHVSDKARRGLEIVRTLGRSSTAKYQAMADWLDPSDGRIRGGLLYHGASTGRWSGRGVQPHNFVRGNIKDMELLWRVLKSQRRQLISHAYARPVMETLAHALRGAIVAAPGRTLYVTDFAAIEARVVMWLAKQEDALDVFRQHKDIYLDMAAEVYDYPLTKEKNPSERQLGKQGILGCGFGMGGPKFQATCASYKIDIDEDLAQTVVNAYRSKYWRVPQMWKDQETAAIDAVLYPDDSQENGRCLWYMDNGFLFCELPGGKRISYPFPEIHKKKTPWGEMRNTLTFMGMNTYTRKWERQHTYGGSIVENQTQAVARNLMAASMLRVEDTGVYRIVLTIHDELLAEAKLGQGSLAEYNALVAACPSWALDCPIEVDGFVAQRYRK